MKNLISSLLILFSLQSLATSPAANLVFEGQLLDSSGNPFTVDRTNVPFKIQVLDGSCIVFEETTSRDLPLIDKGFFSLNIGSYAQTSGSAILVDALDYSNTSLSCLTSDVAKVPSAPRNLKIIVDGEDFGNIPIQSAAYAIHAEKLGGKSASDFVQLNSGYVPINKIGTGTRSTGKYLDGSGAWTTFPTAVTEVTGSTPIDVTTNGTTVEVSITAASSTTSGALSSTDWNTFNNKLGSSTTFSGDMSGGVSTTSVDKIKGKAVEYTASITGGQFLKYDSTGSGKWINSGINFSELIIKPTTLAGYGITDAASSSSLSNYLPLAGGTLTGDLTLNAQKEFRLADADSSHYVGLKSPSSVASNKVWTLPATDGTDGQFLKTDGNGVLSWVSGNSGTVTGVTGIGPISVTTSGTTPEVSIAEASDTTSGALSATDWNAFNNKLGTGLASGKIWVGNNDVTTPTATAVPVSGDVSLSFDTLTTSGKMILEKIKGVAISTTPPSVDGQVLRYNSSTVKWEPSFVAIGDLRSSVTGTIALPEACSAGQTLTWSSASDALSCSDIVVSESNFANQVQKTFLAGPISGTNLSPSFRTIASTDLPAVFSPPVGSAALPSYAFSGDLNTGVFGAAADILGFSTNSIERMRIDGSGNVGIGTITPATALSVEKNINLKDGIVFTNTNNGINAMAELRVSNDSGASAAIQVGSSNHSNVNARGNAIFAARKGITFLSDNETGLWSTPPEDGFGTSLMRFVVGGYEGKATVVIKPGIDKNVFGSVFVGSESSIITSETSPSVMSVNGTFKLRDDFAGGFVKLSASGMTPGSPGNAYEYIFPSTLATAGQYLKANTVDTGNKKISLGWSDGTPAATLICPTNMTLANITVTGDSNGYVKKFCYDPEVTTGATSYATLVNTCASNGKKLCSMQQLQKINLSGGGMRTYIASEYIQFAVTSGGAISTLGTPAGTSFSYRCCVE